MKEELLLQEAGIITTGTEIMKDGHKAIGMMPMPFQSFLSFEPLINFLKKKIAGKGYSATLISKPILQMLDEAPELTQPIDDIKILEKYPELVDLLIGVVLPIVSQETQLAKLTKPFDMNDFYHTPAVGKLLDDHEINYEINRSSDLLQCAAIISACSLILNTHYGQDLKVAPPISISARKSGGKISRHFKMNLETSFIKIKKLKPLKPLSQTEINQLLTNIYDTEMWLEAIPPDAFQFEGFMISSLIDITEEEAVSRLKQRLLQQDAVVTEANIKKLECLVSNYLHVEDLQLGLTAIDYPKENAVSHKYKIRFDFLKDDVEQLLKEEHQNSIYEKACKYKQVLLIEDLENMEYKTPIEEGLLKKGIRSIIIAPLLNKKNKVIGLLEIGSARAYELHSFIEIKFKDIIGLFSMAVERSRNEIDNQIEAVIREQFTDVHPSVEWRFIEASYNLLENRQNGQNPGRIEPIIFHDVYPLYGQADIVGSSRKRNIAIQADLLDNLHKVRAILDQTAKAIRFPLLNQFMMQVDHGIADLRHEFNSNDESRIVELLHQEIHPILRFCAERHPQLEADIEEYFAELDDELQIIYNKRKNYEDSVTMLNDAIGNLLDRRDQESQALLPHYYAKYKTDGVEYDQYFGQSLLKHERFCNMHLQNFRLQQLIDMCEVTRLVAGMQNKLPEKMSTAQLVFAYTNTLSIRFREDEKQFDVDGAYNVRYEILKKRIDKAVVDGTDERITQAGKIAIVYLQEKDKQEYLKYIEYLRHEGLIDEKVEDLSLARLQGAQGLKALRITVNLDK